MAAILAYPGSKVIGTKMLILYISCIGDVQYVNSNLFVMVVKPPKRNKNKIHRY